MRVHDLIAQHSIPWPPPVVAAVRPFEKLPVPSEVRQALLESVFWREDDAQPGIDLHLQLHGGMATGALVGRPRTEAGLPGPVLGAPSRARAGRWLRSRTSKSLPNNQR